MKITGIIVAGGKSSRMGFDKGMSVFRGKKFIDYTLTALLPNVDEVIIIANNTHYDYLGYPVYEDVVKNCGPLGGIYTGLLKSKTEKNFVISCDMPFVSKETIAYIISKVDESEITVPVHDEQLEPLCAVYSKACTETIKQLVDKKIWKLQDALRYFKTNYIYAADTEFLSAKNFININTPEELKKYGNDE